MIFFQYDFLFRALLAGLLAGVLAPLIGQFIVVRRMPLLADTLAHVSLVGVAGALYFGLSPLVGAGVAAILAALGMEKLRSSGGLSGESVLAVFLSGGLSIALLIASLSPAKSAGLFSYLFGSISTVSSSDLWFMLGLGLCSLLLVAVFYRQFLVVAWQEELAEANGLRSKLLSLTTIILAALAVVVSLRVVGVLLIGALMVIPVNLAILAGQGFLRTMGLSILASIISVVLGLWLSFQLDLPSGAMIVLVSLVLFAIGLSIKKIRYG